MNGGGKLVVMILAGILIASVIIFSVNALEQGHVIPPQTTGTSTTVTSTSTSITTSTITTTTVQENVSTGVLAAQITDPPNLPTGTTHIYINYSAVEAQTVDQYGDSVWYTIAKPGEVDLVSVVNEGLTLGSAVVPSGVYTQARFDITNATVTYGGKNYSATVPLAQVSFPISSGGATVRPNASTGFDMDIIPALFGSNTGSRPSFELVTGAQGLPIPAADWNNSTSRTGATTLNITSEPWFPRPSVVGAGNLSEVVPPEISSGFLLVILNNTGTSSIVISGLNILTSGTSTENSNSSVTTLTTVRTITTVTTITEITTISASSTSTSNTTTSSVPKGSDASPSEDSLQASVQAAQLSSSSTTNYNTTGLETVAQFAVLSDGSIVQSSGTQTPILPSMIGLTIQPGHETVLLFSGQISTLNSVEAPYQPQSIIGGQEYTIQLVTPTGSSVEFTVNASYPG